MNVARPRLGVREQLVLSFLWFGINFQYGALLPIVVPAQIPLLIGGPVGGGGQAILLGALAGLGAAIVVVTQPVVGAWSDRTATPFGRRRPFILAGGVIAFLGMLALGRTDALALYFLGFAALQVGANAATAGYQALLPDLVPPEQRGEASGYLGLMTMLGTAASFAAAALLLRGGDAGGFEPAAIEDGARTYYGIAAVLVVAGLAVTLTIREPVRAAVAVRARSWLAPLRHHNFRWVFAARFAVMFGLMAFLTFVEYFLAQVWAIEDFVGATATIALVALLGAAASALAIGALSDRSRRVPIVVVATSVMALAALVFALSPEPLPLVPLGLVFGLGYGGYASVDWALAVDTLPTPETAGRDLGVWNMALALPATLAPLVGALVVGAAAAAGSLTLGYRLVFLLAAIALVGGALAVMRVRELATAPAAASREA